MNEVTKSRLHAVAMKNHVTLAQVIRIAILRFLEEIEREEGREK